MELKENKINLNKNDMQQCKLKYCIRDKYIVLHTIDNIN